MVYLSLLVNSRDHQCCYCHHGCNRIHVVDAVVVIIAVLIIFIVVVVVVVVVGVVVIIPKETL